MAKYIIRNLPYTIVVPSLGGTKTLNDLYVSNVDNNGNVDGNINKQNIEYELDPKDGFITSVTFNTIDDTAKTITFSYNANTTNITRKLNIKLKNSSNNTYITVELGSKLSVDTSNIITFTISGIEVTRIALFKEKDNNIPNSLPGTGTIILDVDNNTTKYNLDDHSKNFTVNTYSRGLFNTTNLNSGDTFVAYGYQTGGTNKWLTSYGTYTYDSTKNDYTLSFNVNS